MDLINLDVGSAAFIALMGYLVVFIGLILLMIVIMVMGKIMVSSRKKEAAKEAQAAPAPSAAPVTRTAPAAADAEPAAEASAPAAQAASVEAVETQNSGTMVFPGSAGQIALYDTDPREAAMVMAVIADALGKPLNTLRFKSIKEVK
ncbi:MAG: hypothetical protein E7240_03530 [Lachnospiraceae bacterium]|nr:hypothetical protein [Lachnospiraceae bacterium]